MTASLAAMSHMEFTRITTNPRQMGICACGCGPASAEERDWGVIEEGLVKPSTVHQELRVLRRMLNVAVRRKLLRSNPCWGVEFPVTVKGLFRPALRLVVGAATNRSRGAGISEECGSDHHRDRTAYLQGADADEEGSSRPTERSRLDPGFENSELASRRCR